MTATRIAGVDGCPGGWVRISRSAEGDLNARLLSTQQLCEDATHYAVTAIDIPIGLSQNGIRDADRAARRVLGWPRSSSVFSAPPRVALLVDSYEEACARSFLVSGKRLSRQTYNILPKIREVDGALRAAPPLVGTFYEVHPEVSFCYMANGTPMAFGKKTPKGKAERLALIEAHFGEVFSAMRRQFTAGSVRTDDIIDALVALWTAERIQSGASIALSDRCEIDEAGLPMQIRA